MSMSQWLRRFPCNAMNTQEENDKFLSDQQQRQNHSSGRKELP